MCQFATEFSHFSEVETSFFLKYIGEHWSILREILEVAGLTGVAELKNRVSRKDPSMHVKDECETNKRRPRPRDVSVWEVSARRIREVSIGVSFTMSAVRTNATGSVDAFHF